MEILLRSYEEVLADKTPDIIEYLRVFELACLLHDVGHAPFSHTGEQFCLQNGDRGNSMKSFFNLQGMYY